MYIACAIGKRLRTNLFSTETDIRDLQICKIKLHSKLATGVLYKMYYGLVLVPKRI